MSLTSTTARPAATSALGYLRDRMRKPQRHRLLHGYPAAAAMRPRPAGMDIDAAFDPAKGLLVGVLPHPFCNPKVAGCGFCTFPHQDYDHALARRLAESVVREIAARTANQPGLRRRPVAALYVGGGTANLTPPDAFRSICRALAAHFDLSQAEVTLEGVPAYFLKRQPLLMDVMREEMPARHFRLSMGVQTFDAGRLKAMGRDAFGDAGTFAAVTDAAHARGFTASADLLFNLPHQTLPEMKRDLARADALGLDHLGLYHLVMFRGLGTEWSRDPALLAGLPDNETAAANWAALREHLLAGGFVQTTLTNFERAGLAGTGRRFVYEELTFRPAEYDMIGFGPGGISVASTHASGIKLLNPEQAGAYLDAVARNPTSPWASFYSYGPEDLRAFRLTRRLAALEVGAETGTEELLALYDEDLIDFADDGLTRPTPRGMFYSDSIASLFARRAVAARRGVEIPEEAVSHGRMG